MYTAEKVVEVLDKIGVTYSQIVQWEDTFALNIPRNSDGYRMYEDNHIKLFKSIKKLTVLGYPNDEIRKKLNLNSPTPQRPVFPDRNIRPSVMPGSTSNPMRPAPHNHQPQQHPNPAIAQIDNLPLIKLIERLMDEKNQLMMEKNYMQEQLHLLELQEKELSKTSLEYSEQVVSLTAQVEILEEQLRTSVAEIPADKFLGSWSGKAKLLKVVFDTLETDIPKERNKLFKVTDPPKRLYGNLAVFMSTFNCEEDPLWERVETYRVAYMNDEELRGELDVEYFVDNVAVAKAIYSITCNRRS